MHFRSAFENSSPWLQVFWLIAAVVLAFLFVFVGGYLLGCAFFSLSPSSLVWAMGDVSDPQRVAILKYMQVVQTLGLFVCPPFLLAWLYSPHPMEYLRLSPRPDGRSLLWGALALICILFPSNYLAGLNAQWTLPDALHGVEQWMRSMEDQLQELNDLFLQVSSFQGLLANIFVVAVMAAVGEELFFRGILQPLMIRISGSVFRGVLLTSLLFAAIHLQFFGFVPRMIMGMFMGYLLVWSRSLWVPILAHFINNLLGVVLAYGMFNGWLPSDSETIWTDTRFWPLWVGGAILTGFFLWRLKSSRFQIGSA